MLQDITAPGVKQQARRLDRARLPLLRNESGSLHAAGGRLRVALLVSLRWGSLADRSTPARECRFFVEPEARRTSPETSAPARSLAASLQAPKRGFGECQGTGTTAARALSSVDALLCNRRLGQRPTVRCLFLLVVQGGTKRRLRRRCRFAPNAIGGSNVKTSLPFSSAKVNGATRRAPPVKRGSRVWAADAPVFRL